MYSRTKSVIVTAVTLALNAVCFYWIARAVGSSHPLFYATAFSISLFVHELGHALVLEYYGIKTNMFFFLIGAGVGPGKGYMAKYKALDSDKQTFVFLAGTMGNATVITVSALLAITGIADPVFCKKIMWFNGTLIVWNLIPLGMLDGGRFMKAFFESIRESEEVRYAKALMLLVSGGVAALCIATRQTYFLPACLLIFGIKRSAETDDPQAFYSKKKLTPQRRFFWLAVWMGLLLIGSACDLTLPNMFG